MTPVNQTNQSSPPVSPPLFPAGNPSSIIKNVENAVPPVSPPLFPAGNPSSIIKNVENAVSDIEKNWKSPAFWVHAAVQVLAWVSYFHSGSNSLKYGALTLSGGALLSYLLHLVGISKKA